MAERCRTHHMMGCVDGLPGAEPFGSGYAAGPQPAQGFGPKCVTWLVQRTPSKKRWSCVLSGSSNHPAGRPAGRCAPRLGESPPGRWSSVVTVIASECGVALLSCWVSSPGLPGSLDSVLRQPEPEPGRGQAVCPQPPAGPIRHDPRGTGWRMGTIRTTRQGGHRRCR